MSHAGAAYFPFESKSCYSRVRVRLCANLARFFLFSMQYWPCLQRWKEGARKGEEVSLFLLNTVVVCLDGDKKTHVSEAYVGRCGRMYRQCYKKVKVGLRRRFCSARSQQSRADSSLVPAGKQNTHTASVPYFFSPLQTRLAGREQRNSTRPKGKSVPAPRPEDPPFALPSPFALLSCRLDAHARETTAYVSNSVAFGSETDFRFLGW